MLFNSYTFLFAFLPVALLGYFALGRLGKAAGAGWLALCSLFFYAWWDHRYVVLLLTSIGVNYVAGGVIARHAGTRKGKRALWLAVAANMTLLGYYKYADFFISSTNAALGTNWPALGVLLPIGISFFTFTQIAYLADSYAGKVVENRFVYYLLFVTYFPHLIAGPVLHHKEMMPQFDVEKNYRFDLSNISIGLTIFTIGLAKKVLIADNLAGFVTPVFSPGLAHPDFFVAWGGALAYTFQLYFDFSGYSDMAIGLSRLFGVRLPLNFNSPYKAANIAEFWRRWHMTLSRFLRDYLYIPLGGNRKGGVRRQLNLMATMVLGGLWHGAGWTFVIWGALHGGFLVVHQMWQGLAGRSRLRSPAQVGRMFGGMAVAFTFICVVFAWVYFRAPDLATANRLVLGMLGSWGAALPESLLSRLGPLQSGLAALGIGSYLGGGSVFVETWAWVALGAAVAFFAPNTQEIMARFSPALTGGDARPQVPHTFAWQPTRSQALWVGIVLALGILALSRPSEFLYFQF